MVLGFAAMMLAACDEAGVSSPTESIEKARDYLASGDYQASVIELKNALQAEPENAEARLLLGETYLEMYNWQGAQKELERASAMGADENSVVVPLSRVKYLAGDFPWILAEAEVNDEMTPEQRADIHVLHGQVRLRQGHHEESEAEFNRALGEKPDHVEAIIGVGAVALARGDQETAEKQLSQAREIDENNLHVHLLDGDIASRERDFERSETAFAKAVEVNGLAPEARLGLIWAQLQNKNADGALETVKPLLKVRPDDPILNYLNSVAYFDKQEFQLAKDHAEAALLASRNHLPSRLIAGISSYMLGAHEQARRHLAAYVADVPDHALARKTLAASQLAVGRNKEAAETLEGVEIETTNDTQLLAAIGQQVLRDGDLEASREIFERVVEIRPESSHGRTGLAAANLGLGETETSIEELERALQANPGNVGAAALLIVNYLNDGKYDEALRSSLEMQQTNPESPHGYTLAGLAEAGKGDVDGAVQEFRRALEVSPGDYNATNNLALILIDRGEEQEAQQLYEEALEVNPNHGPLLLKVAQMRLNMGETQAARDLVERVVELYPNDDGLKMSLARLYMRTGEPLKALDQIEGVSTREARNPALFELTGNAYLASQQMPEAIATHEAWKEAHPNMAAPYLYLARIYEEQGEFFQSGREIAEALRLAEKGSPEDISARYFYGRLLARTQQLDKAEKELRALRRDHPESADVATLAGDIAIARGQVAEAAKAYGDAWEIRKESNLLRRLSGAETLIGKGDVAIERMEKWLADHPIDTGNRFVLADMYLTQGQNDKALELYKSLLERYPDVASAQNNLASLLAERGELEAALTHAERARVLEPNDTTVMDTLAGIYLKMGRMDEALELLQIAARSSKTPAIKFHLAQVLAEHGSRQEAIDVLRGLLADSRPFSQRQQAEALLDELEG
ncbi:MAG: XrtA/PEP-CTERM system TPR-repeat protein PrsT [Pseudomonadota bacterium]